MRVSLAQVGVKEGMEHTQPAGLTGLWTRVKEGVEHTQPAGLTGLWARTH